MKIAFLSNKITIRGTEVCLYDYAHFNEKILGHTSIIITRPYDLVMRVSPRDVSKQAYDKFTTRFPVYYYYELSHVEEICKRENVDVLFIEKAGSPSDGLHFPSLKTIIHCVFTAKEPHGTLYTAISDFIKEDSKNYSIPTLPYMVHVAETDENLRKELRIPQDAIVFGSYSGADEYTDLDCRKIVETIGNDPNFNNIYFIFMNIDQFCKQNDHIRFLPGSTDMITKRKFINTCDAMLYGRKGGETFGLACGEFSICNKPIIARPGQHSHAHEDILGNAMIPFSSYESLYTIITNWHLYVKDVSNNGYHYYTPENVMKNFEHWLNKI